MGVFGQGLSGEEILGRDLQEWVLAGPWKSVPGGGVCNGGTFVEFETEQEVSVAETV